MAWSLQAGAVADYNATSTGSIAMPADVATGDWLYLFLNTDTLHTITGGTTGWTAETALTTSADGPAWFSQYVSGSPPSSPNVTFDTSESGVAVIIRVRGALADSPMELFTQQVSTTTTASIDPTVAGSLKIAFGHDDPTGSSSTTWGSGFTELVDYPRPGNAYITIAYKEEDTAGAATYTTTESMANGIFSLKPSTGDFSVSADPGSFTLAGVSATILSERAITADPGSYALTGIASELLRGLVVEAAPGSFSVTGIAAELVYDAVSQAYTLNAEVGVFSLTGVSSSTLLGRILDAAPGSYTLTGTEAANLAARVLSANPGAFALTGITANTVYSGEAAVSPSGRIVLHIRFGPYT